ncbi:MAG: ROK family protein, partial [Acidobacteria bacterium]|nr:ROK family protein [Acidobacteriota bacterium]
TLAADHPAWELETEYIARALANIILVLSPRRIIIGGSVRKAGHLGEERFFALVRERVRLALKGYLGSPSLAGEIDRYIVPPVLGDDAGVCGAIALGQRIL